MEQTTQQYLANGAIAAALVATGILGWQAWHIHTAAKAARAAFAQTMVLEAANTPVAVAAEPRSSPVIRVSQAEAAPAEALPVPSWRASGRRRR